VKPPAEVAGNWPAIYPALTRLTSSDNEAGASRISPSDSGLVDGGVYGTRTRGLRRDSHEEYVSTHGGDLQPLAITDCRDAPGGDTSQQFVPFCSQAVTPGLQSRSVLVVPHERLLTVREAAARLGVSTSTVYKLCAQGRLAHVRISNAVRLSPRELEPD